VCYFLGEEEEEEEEHTKSLVQYNVYCDKGHKVDKTFQVPHDNLKRRPISRVSCSGCLVIIPAELPAFNCECGSYVLCLKCIEAGSKYPAPPKCTVCATNDLHSKAFTTCKQCIKCERITGKREPIWMCSFKGCKSIFCEQCFPPSKPLSPPSHPESSTSAASKNSSPPSRATSAPMPSNGA
jgi:hypothetical protein